MTSPFACCANPDLPLAGKSVEELLRFVADDDQGYRSDATAKLLSMGISGIFPELERGVRDDNDADFRNGAMDILVAFGKESLPCLVRFLQDENEEVRNFAAVMLGDIGNRRAVEPLIKALSDKDLNVSHSAAEALGKIGDRSALFPLIELLKGDFWVQFSAISALGAMRDYRAVPHLLEILNNEVLAEPVVLALGEIRDPRALYPLGKILPTVDIGLAGLVARTIRVTYSCVNDAMKFKNTLSEFHQPEHIKKVIDSRGIEKLHCLLKSEIDPEAAEAAIILLGWLEDASALASFYPLLQNERFMSAVETAVLSMGKAAKESLIAALPGSNDNVKIVALRSLRNIGSLEYHDFLTDIKSTSNDELKLELLESVKISTPDAFIPYLFELLKSGNEVLVYKAAEVLGCYPLCAVSERLRHLAGSGVAEERRRAALLLCYLKEEDGLPVLDLLIHDADPDVRKSAIKSIGAQRERDAVPKLSEALADPDLAIREAAVMALAEFRTPMLVDGILHLLGSGEESLDYAVVRAIGLMEMKDAENRLLEYLEMGSLSKRLEYAAIEALGRISAKSSSELICKRYLVSSDHDMRRLAVETLGLLGDRNSTEAVESALNDAHWSVRVAAIKVLAKLGGIKEVPLIMNAVSDPDPMVRKHAILTLGEIRSISSIPLLVHQLIDNEMSKHAFVSLLKFGRTVLPWLHRQMMKNYTVEVRLRLIDIIGKIGDQKSVEPLMELLEDHNPAIRLSAIDSLAFCFDSLLLKRLSSVMSNDSDEEVRIRAGLALKTFTMERYN
ncbi:MAG TPA: HEAT repeat domain-containing protein [Geobacteraceae bacterium]|nr:HEAT repeat domain-containing protein [Geobacteraceae bacterium]